MHMTLSCALRAKGNLFPILSLGCMKLQGPAHGKLHGNILGMLRIGAQVVIECNPGYVLNQTVPLVCNDGGRWSGEIPACIEGKCWESTAQLRCLMIFDEDINTSATRRF